MGRSVEVFVPEYQAGWTEIVVPDALPLGAVHQNILVGEPWPEVVHVRGGERVFIKPSAIIAIRERS